MIALLLFLVSLPLSVFSLWVLYLAVMNLKRAKNAGQLSIGAKAMGSIALLIGYVLDAYVNIFVMTVLLCELPEELTVTSRLKRHKSYETAPWSQKVVRGFQPLLDPYDPSGTHI